MLKSTGPVDGTEYRLIDVMSATPLGALRLRHFCVSCSAEAEFDNAGHIEPSLFIGREIVERRKLGTDDADRRAQGFGD